MKIKVTKKHIQDGWARQPFQCPVALAIREAILAKLGPIGFADTMLVSAGVGAENVDITTPTREVRRKLPTEVREFIKRVDADADVQPFEFELPLKKLGL